MANSPLGYSILKYGHAEPIYETPRGIITTAAFVLCGHCKAAIRSSGGPMHNALCPACYDLYKLNNFIEGGENR